MTRELIQQVDEEVERLVAERTAELKRTTEELRRQIAEREQVEAAQRQSQDQFEALVQSIDGIVWEVDARTFSFTFVSKQAEKLLGYPLERWLNDPSFWADHIYPEDRDWAVRFCVTATEQKVDHQFEYRMIAADGRILWLKDFVTVSVMEDRSVRLRGVMVDITEQKQAEEERRQLLNQLGERVKELTALHGAAHILQEGFNTPQALQQLISLLLPAFQYPENTEVRISMGQTVAATPNFIECPATLRTCFNTAGGEPGCIEVTYVDGGPPEGVEPFLPEERALLNTFADMLRTSYDRREAKETLRLKEQRFRALFENSSDGVTLLSADGKILYASPSTPQLLGYEPEELVRFVVFDLVHEEDKEGFAQKLAEVVGRPRAKVELQVRVRHKDGSYKWLEGVFTNLLHEPNVGAIVNNYRDVSERIQAARQLRANSEQLRALSVSVRSTLERERTTIAREIHDELGSALTSLRWDLESLTKIFCDPGGREKELKLIKKVEGMLKLTDETVGVVRRIASDLRPSILDDLGLVAAIEWQAEQFQERTGILCTCDCSVEGLEFTQEQSTAIFRIFQEALTNILRHASATEVHIEGRSKDEVFILTIADNGRGIREQEKHGELSLGILGMRERVHLINGEIEITGAENQGTTITVRVPVAEKKRESPRSGRKKVAKVPRPSEREL